MFTKVYNLKFPGIEEAKIAVSFLSEEIGGSIADANISNLSILLDKEGQVSVSVRFDSASEMKKFCAAKGEVFDGLRKSFTLKLQEMSAVAVFNYDREAMSTM
ncbi:hypothetical protein BVC71_10070 [Marivivens niveibacter]|uniref:ABM domain-containing protein n=1 Tax=Marivivens niveibacter TaxID=1930667 RepID=A0A251WX24_9RHOB|nr:hypothetical protein [Marivivens niveibacter]OUD09050.1 hypothetical protein BVC71_10070 [Marivivens niveibacter]